MIFAYTVTAFCGFFTYCIVHFHDTNDFTKKRHLRNIMLLQVKIYMHFPFFFFFNFDLWFYFFCVTKLPISVILYAWTFISSFQALLPLLFNVLPSLLIIFIPEEILTYGTLTIMMVTYYQILVSNKCLQAIICLVHLQPLRRQLTDAFNCIKRIWLRYKNPKDTRSS